ncbi:MAG: COX15/CtaA family protein [Pseudorhodoplanes sp.]|nr:COX15/CtaA family protein [Pseudorhodoplanes sp.]
MTASDNGFARRAVSFWLLAVAALVFATVLVGGATRLTESGLSIVEWKPVTGAVPPLSEPQWQAEFDKYKTIPQWRELNRNMTLAEFKVIYLWEWAHRLLGRLIGAAFLLPFLFFLWRGWIAPGERARLWGIFALGALQGAVGWWMVASGLSGRVSVSQYRLAFHLTLACVIYAALIWTARRMLRMETTLAATRQQWTAIALVVLVLVQIYLGALVAGLDAGLTYNTWPPIDGGFIPAPERLWFETPWWRNLFENALTVQFNHRMMAYLLVLVALWHLIDVARTPGRREALSGAMAVFGTILSQALVGVLTLLQQVPLSLALVHQGMAVLVLTAAVLHAERLLPRREKSALSAQLAAQGRSS